MGNSTVWFSNRSDTNLPSQSQKMARDWKFWIKKEEELYYLCSDNKDADQRLCFHLCKLLVF